MSDKEREDLNPEDELISLDEDQEVSEDQTEEESESVVSEMETAPEEVEKAKKNGYLTREEYVKKHGSDKGFKSPEEFNHFGDHYSEIKTSIQGLSKKLEQRDKELEASLKYIERVRERERTLARQELQKGLKQAQEYGDVEEVRRLTKEEAKLDFAEAQEAATKAAEDTHIVLQRFQERNPWYNRDMEMTHRAIQIEHDIINGRYSYQLPVPTTHEQLAQQVELLVKNEFKDRRPELESTRTEPAISNTRSSMAKSKSQSGTRFKDLPSELQSIYHATNRMLSKNKMPTYTEAEYIKKLQNDGEI